MRPLVPLSTLFLKDALCLMHWFVVKRRYLTLPSIFRTTSDWFQWESDYKTCLFFNTPTQQYPQPHGHNLSNSKLGMKLSQGVVNHDSNIECETKHYIH